MRSPGLVGTIQLAAVVVFALPLALFGLLWFSDGHPLGLAFVAVAALMLVLPRLLTNPLDPGDVTEAAVERIVGGRDED